MNRNLIHPIKEQQIRQYEEDGVVCIRGQFDQNWIDRMLAAGIGYIDNPCGPRYKRDDEDDPGFISGTHMSRYSDEFMEISLNSPAAQIAASLMRLEEVRFFFDQLFIKDPGTLARTDWHNDLPYWPFNGNHLATVWVTSTPVTKETSGLVYVAGSHKWKKMFKPLPAARRGDLEYLSEEARRFEDCPQFDKEFNNPAFNFLSWDMEAGDALVHHPLTVHGSGENASKTQRRVALSLRYFGGDATWQSPRTQFSIPSMVDSNVFEFGKMPVNDAIFPVAWKGVKSTNI